jgi:hypothetical protein
MFFGLVPTLRVGTGLRLAGLSWLHRSPAAKLWTRGWGAEVTAGLMGVFGEAAVFPVATRVGALALGEKLSWEGEQLGQEALGSLLFLGGMRLATGGTSGVRQFIAAGRPMAAGINKLMHSGWAHQTSLIGGIALGQQFETWAGVRQPTEGSAKLFEVLSTYGQVWGAGIVTGGLWGPRLARWEQAMEAQIRKSGPSTRRNDAAVGKSLFPTLQPGFTAAGPMVVAAKNSYGIFSRFRPLFRGTTARPPEKLQSEPEPPIHDAETQALARLPAELGQKSLRPGESEEAEELIKLASPKLRAALLEQGDNFFRLLNDSLTGFSSKSPFLRKMLWSLFFPSQSNIDFLQPEQQVENVFLWPYARQLADLPVFKRRLNSLSRMPFRFALNETINGLQQIKLESSWGPFSEFGSISGRNYFYHKAILAHLIPSLHRIGRPLLIHNVGDGLGRNSFEMLQALDNAGYRDVRVVSSDFDRELFYIRRGKRTAVLDREGRLLAFKMDRLIFSPRNRPPRKLYADLRRDFLQSAPDAEREVHRDGDFVIRSVRFVTPEVDQYAREHPDKLRFVTANLLNPRSIFSAAGREVDLTTLFNVINAERFSPRQIEKALINLGRTLREGGVLAVGFSEGEWSRAIDYLNIYHREGDRLFPSPFGSFPIHAETYFPSLKL